MEMAQIYKFVNTATTETLGQADLVEEDLSNIVDVGEKILNANSMDKYVRSLVDHIGKVVFVNRPYTGVAPSVLRDGWEYGAILEKITAQMPKATENESWELTDGTSYDPNIFYKPNVSAKFFNKRTTWEIPFSFTERQARGSFSSASQMNGFLSMLDTAVSNSKTIKTSDMVQRTINNMIGETANSAANNDRGGTTRYVNVLADFNKKFNKTYRYLSQAINDPDFIRYVAYVTSLYQARMKKMSTLFNIGGEPRFTPKDRLHTIMLAEFRTAAGIYLQSDVYHKELVALPESEEVPYWQGMCDDANSLEPFDIATNSKVKVKISSDPGTSVEVDGVIGVMFDREALGVCNEDQRVTTNYNPKAEFYTNWYKVDTGYFNDLNENFVVFYADDPSQTPPTP